MGAPIAGATGTQQMSVPEHWFPPPPLALTVLVPHGGCARLYAKHTSPAFEFWPAPQLLTQRPQLPPEMHLSP
jgi:hypothetical protein